MLLNDNFSTGFADPQILPNSATKCLSALMRIQLAWHLVAAAESRQDWSPLVLTFTSTTPDPVWSGPHWQHWCAASYFNPQPQGLHRRWHDHEDHVTAIVRACLSALHQIRSMRWSLSRHALLTLVCALIVRKVDYCNLVLAGISGQLQDRLQSVFNAATRLVFSAMRSERITPLLRELHWSRVPERITFRLSSWKSAVVPCWGPSPDSTSTLDAFCVLLTQLCWWCHPPDVQN